MADDSAMPPFDTGHEEMIHDAQLDYYGKRVATASSDRTIKIFELQGKNQVELAHLKGHTGPVWQVAWGHPSLGNLLASCSYDRKVCIWQEVRKNQWQCIHTDNCHQASVNSVAWAPHELGRVLACASADGTVSIISYNDNRWVREGPFPAHAGGVNAVSWAPAIPSGSLVLPQPQAGGVKLQKCIVTGGCDNKLKIWRFSLKTNQWDEETKIFGKTNGQKHQGWVRDVAWAPSLGLPGNTIASCSEDGMAIIWSDGKNGTIEPVKEIKRAEKMWRVSWSTMGNILAISMGNNTVSLWKESVDGKWQDLAQCDEGLPNKKEQKMG